nr:MAG TPA: hypothetical protein [Bacteriophage sp.]DAM73690.1 MAG TPA: hypothetical protein [Bacteriophage sp.]
MMQSYAFIHKNNVFSKNFMLNFVKSNNLKAFIANILVSLHHQPKY